MEMEKEKFDGEMCSTFCPSSFSKDNRLQSSAKKKGIRGNRKSEEIGGDRARKGRRLPHGKIGFTELASVVSRRWRQLDPKSRSVFESLARVEHFRYERELEQWNADRVAEAERQLAEVAWKERGGSKEESHVDVVQEEDDDAEVYTDSVVKAKDPWAAATRIIMVTKGEGKRGARPVSMAKGIGRGGLESEIWPQDHFLSSVQTFKRSRSDSVFFLAPNKHQRCCSSKGDDKKGYYFYSADGNGYDDDRADVQHSHQQQHKHQSRLFFHAPEEPLSSNQRYGAISDRPHSIDNSRFYLHEVGPEQQWQQQQQQQQEQGEKDLTTLASDSSIWQPLATFKRGGSVVSSSALVCGRRLCEQSGQQDEYPGVAEDIALDEESIAFFLSVFDAREDEDD